MSSDITVIVFRIRTRTAMYGPSPGPQVYCACTVGLDFRAGRVLVLVDSATRDSAPVPLQEAIVTKLRIAIGTQKRNTLFDDGWTVSGSRELGPAPTRRPLRRSQL
jgi:hypothetical protein